MQVTITRTITENIDIPDAQCRDIAIQYINKILKLPNEWYIKDDEVVYTELIKYPHRFKHTVSLRKATPTDKILYEAIQILKNSSN